MLGELKARDAQRGGLARLLREGRQNGFPSSGSDTDLSLLSYWSCRRLLMLVCGAEGPVPAYLWCSL